MRLQLDDEVDVVVGRPCALERRFDDRAVLVARHPAAALLDALDGMGDGRRIAVAGPARAAPAPYSAAAMSTGARDSVTRAFSFRFSFFVLPSVYVLLRARAASRLQLICAFGSAFFTLLNPCSESCV